MNPSTPSSARGGIEEAGGSGVREIGATVIPIILGGRVVVPVDKRGGTGDRGGGVGGSVWGWDGVPD